MNTACRRDFLKDFSRWVADRPTLLPSQWALDTVTLPASEERGQGPLSWSGREFCAEPLDCFADPIVSDVVCCFGSQIGKTVLIMCGIGYLLDCDPCGILWVMPDKDLARSFSQSRWMPFVELNKNLAPLIPRGSQRHKWANLAQKVGGSWVNFVGSNSRAGLSSRPKRIVALDEMDKFPVETRGGEAGAINLAEQRVKDAAMPKRIKTSTPSTSDGPGWVEFQKGDQRRYLVPCPHCRAGVFLAWIKGQSALKPDPRDAHIAWDETAKRDDNSWDFDRVVASAHCVCPHCNGKIENHHKTEMVRNGNWKPTALAPSSFRSYHLPSLYASSPTTTFGLMARAWLMGLRSIEGVQGFVNGMLAEPWESQSEKEQRTETILLMASEPIATGAVRILSIDCQRGQPAFYWVCREWDANTGNSRRVGFGTCDSWADLDAIALRMAVLPHHVVIDSGDGVKQAEIFRECASRGRDIHRRGSCPLRVGWTPAKGFDREKRWVKKAGGQPMPFGTNPADLPHSEYELRVFQFAGPYIHDILHELRGGIGRSHGIRWEVIADPDKDPEYWSQMDSKIKRPTSHTRTGRQVWEWEKRSKNARDHYLDCEIQGTAFALFHGLLPWIGAKRRQEDAQ